MHERSLKNGPGRKWSKWARYPVYTSCNPLTDRRGTGFPIKMIPLGPRQDWFSELMTRWASLPHENQKRRGGGGSMDPLSAPKGIFLPGPGLRRHLVRFCFTKKSSRPLSNTEPSATCACGNFSSSFPLHPPPPPSSSSSSSGWLPSGIIFRCVTRVILCPTLSHPRIGKGEGTRVFNPSGGWEGWKVIWRKLHVVKDMKYWTIYFYVGESVLFIFGNDLYSSRISLNV